MSREEENKSLFCIFTDLKEDSGDTLQYSCQKTHEKIKKYLILLTGFVHAKPDLSYSSVQDRDEKGAFFLPLFLS